MSVASADIVISPPAAAAAGCTASATLTDSSSGVDWDGQAWWYKTWKFDAFPAQGWVFDHWEQTYSYQDPLNTGPSGTFTGNHNFTPWETGNYEQFGTQEWEDHLYEHEAGYRFTYRNISQLKAVFRQVHVYTNLILRSASSGAILHGAGGTILHDA